ncbi:response regulator transcription factor [Bifidobacterium leontopitheci]|nr:response regulator transcription factor [Bifidobacterium leontopitheci]
MSNPSPTQACGGVVAIGLVDNDPYALAYLRAAVERLDARFRMVFAVQSGAAAIQRCLYAPHPPHVLVTDMSLTDMGGIDVCARIRQSGSRIGIVGITALDPAPFRERFADAGAQAIVAKEHIPTRLRPAILRAAQGLATVGEADGDASRFTDVTASLERMAAHADKVTAARLSDKELDIIRMYARHMTTADIAEALHISSSTVHVHVHRAMTKLHATSRQEAIRLCGIR